MSFVVGSYYKCISNSAGVVPLTVGKLYKCLVVDTAMGIPYGIQVEDDDGRISSWNTVRFDDTPQADPSIPASPIAQHVAALQQATIGGFAKATPPAKPGTMCCGSKAEKRVFSSFEYMFCTKCKKEVFGKAEQLNTTPQELEVPMAWDEILKHVGGS